MTGMNNQSLKYHSLGKSNAMQHPVTIMLSAINRLFQACKSKATLASYKKAIRQFELLQQNVE
jgi:hypothetical protein